MSRRNIRVLVSLTLIGAAAMFISCSSSNPASSNGGGGNMSPGPDSVNIVNFAFTPSNLAITAGTKVTWTNKSNTAHTVTSDNGTFTSSGNIAPNATYEFTFPSAGTFNYHCTIHPSMAATVTVTP